ncbi:MAG TPA: flagellar biosynthetic protein FliO [Candidatus Limnocylindrales bacterium]
MSRPGSGRRMAVIACVAGLAGVALIGTMHPMAASGGQPTATDALTAATGVGTAWGSGDAGVGINWLDLVPKALIVLVLLFITLRVLGKVGGGTAKRGGRMQVLESRTLAPKASLHLVAIGERRLVVGLTPSGMVSLAELDASELEAEAAPVSEPADGTGLAGIAQQPTFVGALNSLMAPVDAVTGKLALLFGGGRVR